MVPVDFVSLVRRNVPLFVQHSNMDTVSLDTHTVLHRLGQKCLQSFGNHLLVEQQFSAESPAVVTNDAVPISKETQVRDKQGHEQQPQLHCARMSPGKCHKPKSNTLIFTASLLLCICKSCNKGSILSNLTE